MSAESTGVLSVDDVLNPEQAKRLSLWLHGLPTRSVTVCGPWLDVEHTFWFEGRKVTYVPSRGVVQLDDQQAQHDSASANPTTLG